MSENKKPAKVVIAPTHQMTRIKEELNRNGQVITRRVEKPKDKE